MNIEIAPTILELVGIEVPGKMQGKSLLKLVDGGETNWRAEFYYEYYMETLR